MAILGSLAKKILHSKSNMHGGSHGSNHQSNLGVFYGYKYRPDTYSEISGETCLNNLEFDGIVYGRFKCPVEGWFLYIF